MEGNNLQEKQKFPQRSSNLKRRKSLNEDITGLAENSTSTEYFQQLQKILNDQAISLGQNYQQLCSFDDTGDFLDIDNDTKDIQQDMTKYGSSGKKIRSFKSSIEPIAPAQKEEIIDANKRSTSPPSNSIRQSLRSTEKPPEISAKINQMISSSISQQQLLLKIIEENKSEQMCDNLLQLQQLQIQNQETLVAMDKQYALKQSQFDQANKLQNELNFQRFKIKNDIDNDQGSLLADIVNFFGSTQKFMQAFKNDHQLIFNFIKFQQTRIKQNSPKSSNQTKAQMKVLSQSTNNHQAQDAPRRKKSDPLFDNEEYLKQIEEKYLQQFEQQFLQDTQKQEINSLRQSKEKMSVINNDKTKEASDAKKKKKRMQSDDKYDKKDFQERMEQQFLKILKTQFPVDDSDEEEKKSSTATKKPKQEDCTAQFLLSLEQPNFEIQKEIKVQSDHKQQHPHKGSNKGLYIDMPEELVNLLSDSKDMLEDPNSNMNYFETEDQQLQSNAASGSMSMTTGGSVGIETPAFGKKKTPSLALFKGQSGTHSEHQLENSQAKKKRQAKQQQQSPDFVSNKINAEKGPFAYDNWKQEVKKVFQKKKQPQQLTSSKALATPGVITMQNQMSPVPKSKSPQNSLIQQKGISKLDTLSSAGSSNLLMKDKVISKTQTNFLSQHQQLQQQEITQMALMKQQKNVSKSPNSKNSFSSNSNTLLTKSKSTKQQQLSREEAKKGAYGNIINQSLTSVGSLISSRNQKQNNLPKTQSYQQQQLHINSIDIAINKLQTSAQDSQTKDLQLDLKQMEQLTHTFTQSQQLNSARIVGGGGRIPISNLIPKSRNGGPSKSPSLR